MTERKRAKELGMIVGKTYKVATSETGNVEFRKGDTVLFVRDDNSTCPEFLNTRSGYRGFAWAEAMKPATEGVKFEAATRTIETTVITVDRKLTDAEQAEIEAIIEKGNK